MQKRWGLLGVVLLACCHKASMAESADTTSPSDATTPSLPDPATLVRISLYPGCSMTEADARAVLGRARLLVITDPLHDGWSYSPSCSGTAEYKSGVFDLRFFFGGRGRLVSASKNLLFEWTP